MKATQKHRNCHIKSDQWAICHCLVNKKTKSNLNTHYQTDQPGARFSLALEPVYSLRILLTIASPVLRMCRDYSSLTSLGKSVAPNGEEIGQQKAGPWLQSFTHQPAEWNWYTVQSRRYYIKRCIGYAPPAYQAARGDIVFTDTVAHLGDAVLHSPLLCAMP